MSEDTQISSETANDSTKAEKNVYENVPEERFEKVIAERNDARTKLETLQTQINDLTAKQKQREEAELEKKGEYKDLLAKTRTELEQYKNKADKLDAYETSRREQLMRNIINDDDKSIAEGLSLEKLEKFANRVSVSANSGKSVNSRPKTLTEKINIKNDSDIWDMDSKDRKGNWKAIVDSFKK